MAHDASAHLNQLPAEPISRLAPFGALIISVVFVIYFLIRFYILEGFLLLKVYGDRYTNLTEIARRGFVNHHIAGVTKIFIFIIAFYPFINVAFGSASFSSPLSAGSHVTQGDLLIVAAQMLIAMYVFELFYRPKVSPVSVLHHIGTILIGQSAIAISFNLVREKDATVEFLLCMIWGGFDIISEFFPHVTIILYRVYPDSHGFLRKIFAIACITTVIGTTTEIIVTMYLFGSLWHRWTLAFKIVTPTLQLVFAAAQVWGSYCLYQMYKAQTRKLQEKRAKDEDVEHGSAEIVSGKDQERIQVNDKEVRYA